MQRIRLKRVREEAVMPEYKTDGSAGFDLVACESVEIPPHTAGLVPLGWAMEIPKGFYVEIRPRSGVSLKTEFLVINGTVDSDYRGEVNAIVRNTSNSEATVRKGAPIAQGILSPVLKTSFKECGELGETVRGSNGFGSTGM